jgi:hypothetical protein
LRAGSGEDRFEQRLVEKCDVFRRSVQPFGAELHLKCRLLARDVERRMSQLLKSPRDLKQESRFPDAGFPADENH